MKECVAKYTELNTLASDLIKEIEALPSGLNDATLSKAIALNQYARQRKIATVNIDFDVKDKQSRFTYSEVLLLNYTQAKGRDRNCKSRISQNKSTGSSTRTFQLPTVKKYAVKMPATKMKVSEYKIWLHSELQNWPVHQTMTK